VLERAEGKIKDAAASVKEKAYALKDRRPARSASRTPNAKRAEFARTKDDRRKGGDASSKNEPVDEADERVSRLAISENTAHPERVFRRDLYTPMEKVEKRPDVDYSGDKERPPQSEAAIKAARSGFMDGVTEAAAKLFHTTDKKDEAQEDGNDPRVRAKHSDKDDRAHFYDDADRDRQREYRRAPIDKDDKASAMYFADASRTYVTRESTQGEGHSSPTQIGAGSQAGILRNADNVVDSGKSKPKSLGNKDNANVPDNFDTHDAKKFVDERSRGTVGDDEEPKRSSADTHTRSHPNDNTIRSMIHPTAPEAMADKRK
jgi:hypothetical protein